jgi:hypothetical protein
MQTNLALFAVCLLVAIMFLRGSQGHTQSYVTNRFPESWGEPPMLQKRDLVRLPGNYGLGSSTLSNWINRHLQGLGPSGPRHAQNASLSSRKMDEEYYSNYHYYI